MAITSHGQNEEIVDKLNELIAHHRAAIDACDAAAARLGDLTERAEVRHMVSDHFRNVEELSRCVEALGGKPTDAKAEVAADREEIVDLERDQRLLTAVLADEEKLAEVYGSIPKQDVGATKIVPTIDKGTSAVERHRVWLRDRLRS